MKLSKTFYDAVAMVIHELVASKSVVSWDDILEAVKGRNILVKNWLHVRAVLQTEFISPGRVVRDTSNLSREDYLVLEVA